MSRECGTLVVFQNAQEQRLLWRRRLVLHAGGNPWTERFCRGCSRIQAIEAFKAYGVDKRTTICKGCIRSRAFAKVKAGHTWAGTLRKTPAEISLAVQEAQRKRWRAPGATRKRSYIAVDPRSEVPYEAIGVAPCPTCGEPGIHADVDVCLQALRMLVRRAGERLQRGEEQSATWPQRRHSAKR